ncbi:hypothetical protein [Streptomyces hebeiensis]
MPAICGSYARGKAMRLTRLDECGTPVPGPTSTLVSKGFVSVGMTPNYQDPEEITQPDANGDLCIDDQGRPALRWVDLTMVLCNIDPEAISIITGNPLVVNDATPTPSSVGWRLDSELTGTANFALEVWSGKTGQSCGTGGLQYGYWLWPFVVQARIGEATIANAALTLTLTARTSTGSGWGVGPYDVIASAVTPFPEGPLLTPIGPSQHQHFEVTTVAPPTPACGATPLPAAA